MTRNGQSAHLQWTRLGDVVRVIGRTSHDSIDRLLPVTEATAVIDRWMGKLAADLRQPRCPCGGAPTFTAVPGITVPDRDSTTAPRR